MRAATALPAGLVLALAMTQAGCERSGGLSPDTVSPGRTGGARASGSGASGAPKPRAMTFILPEGTPLVVRTTTALSTTTQVSGQAFTAHLEQPLVLNGREVAARGAELEGRIVSSDKGGRVKGRAALAVQMTRLHTAGGRGVEISTTTISQRANATKTKDAVKVGIGSGVGAAVGAIVGGGKGAAIGAAAGAGAGSGVVLATHGDSAVIPAETVLHFTLISPATVTASR